MVGFTFLKNFHKNFVIIFVVDVLLVIGSIVTAYAIRFDFNLGWFFVMASYRWVLPFIVCTKLIVFYFFSLYRGMWRYTSLTDLVNIIKASTISSLIIVSVILFSPWRFVGFSRSVFIMDWVLTILFIAAFRVFVRINYEFAGEDKSIPTLMRTIFRIFMGLPAKGRRLLIIGAGNCGEQIYREIRSGSNIEYHVVGFLDDSESKHGKMIHGAKILGPIQSLGVRAKELQVEEILIAIPSARGEQMRHIVELCKMTEIPFKTIPGMSELINGRVSIKSIREVAYQDLLGREQISLDLSRIGAFLEGKTIMITGAGGSIGSELCRQVSKFRPSVIMLYERAESSLYDIELELKHNFPGIRIIPILADVLQQKELQAAFEKHRPDTVFHTAAYKHVPMLEIQPWKAISNNVQGTINVIQAADHYGVERFVFVSTDKAVRPTNFMGASKRVAEMLVQMQNNCQLSKTFFMIVRFGNVVGSVGSVVPLFKSQIARGGPVTVTHPEVTRYFMTIPEACQLILQAATMGKGGEIFLLKMGTPIKIKDMARDLIRLSGFEPGVDIRINFTGLRPGEKLHEELITSGEGVVPTPHDKIMVLSGTQCHIEDLEHGVQQLIQAGEERHIEKIRNIIKKIVPEYMPNASREQ